MPTMQNFHKILHAMVIMNIYTDVYRDRDKHVTVQQKIPDTKVAAGVNTEKIEGSVIYAFQSLVIVFQDTW